MCTSEQGHRGVSQVGLLALTGAFHRLQSGVADLSLQSRRSAVQQQSYGTSQMARAVLPWPTLARLARVFLIELLAARG